MILYPKRLFIAVKAILHWLYNVSFKACQRLLLLNAVTAKMRLTNNLHYNHLADFLYIWSRRFTYR
jgi:hypothetical protein